MRMSAAEGWRFCLFSFPLYPQYLELNLADCDCSINISSMSESL